MLKEIKVKNIIIGKQFDSSKNYEEFLKLIKKNKINLYAVEIGRKIKIEEGLYFNVLWPDSKNIISENGINNNSLVFKMEYNKFSILFTGDIEKVAEEAILKKYKEANVLKSTILKVAHHGSKSSSIEEFLEKVKLYLQTCCCIIKSDVEKFFRTDDVEDFEDFQKRGLN